MCNLLFFIIVQNIVSVTYEQIKIYYNSKLFNFKSLYKF